MSDALTATTVLQCPPVHPACPARRHRAATGAGALATALALLGAGCGGGPSVSNIPLPTPDTSAVAKADPGSALPPTWSHGALMEIYVRGYQDSDGDGMGDLRGLISRLDYLQALGITGLWLMPVNSSQDRDHGYAVANYRDIEADYGTLADFDELLRQAHARGIGIVIDHVINHSAAQNPLFLNASAAANNPFRDWYVWLPSAPGGWRIYGGDPWRSTDTGAYFAGFWDQMPDFNLRNPQVLAYHHDSLRFWLNRGVDGFRFDAVGNLVENGADAWENQPENDTVMSGVRQLVAGYANRFMVCEAPAAPQSYAFPDSCGSAFAFAQQSNVIGAATADADSVADTANYYTNAPAGMVAFLSNHDSFAGDRLWNQLDGDPAQYRLAAATNLLQWTRTFIYYGEEIGMANGAGLSGDPKLRTPMSWTGNSSNAGFSSARPFRALSANVATANVAAQQADPASLLNFYTQVIALRKARPSLMQGAYATPAVAGRVMSFRRVLGAEQTLVVFNYGRTDATAGVANLPAGASLQRLWPQGAASASASGSGAASLAMPRQSFAVFAVNPAP